MSIDYVRVQWTNHKKIYDLVSIAFFVLVLVCFLLVSLYSFAESNQISTIILLIRGFGLSAFTALHLILAIGPLARLDNRFVVLLYNRRHLGVMIFTVALVHAILVVLYYHSSGVMNPLVSLLTGNTQYGSLSAFPFELFGLAGSILLFVLASTSHDFWQKYFGKVFWKSPMARVAV